MGTLSLAPRADEADDLSRYLRASGEGRWQFVVAVKGAHCANCLGKIESTVRSITGVKDARFNLSAGKLTIVLEQMGALPHIILARIRDLGYDAAPFEAGAVLDATEYEGRSLLHCLAVAAFAAIFTVGLTDAIWYGGDDMDAKLRQSFFLLAAAVAIPATLYSGQPFFKSALAVLRKRRTNMDVPISLALLLSLGLSLYETVSGGRESYFDAAAMLTFLLLVGRYLDFLLRERAHGAARQLLVMQSLLARRFKPDGTLETVPAQDLSPGDRIFLASGDRAPVNGKLVDRGTEVDVSLVTGESMPRRLTAGAAMQAGTIVTGVPIILRVTARVEDSLVADLARLLEVGEQSRGLYVSLADRIARAYVPFVIGLALMVVLGRVLEGASAAVAITNAITVLIITCPCALGLAVPAVQVAATSRLFRRGLFIKSGNALERLAAIDTAVFDKTGTLTLGAPVLTNAHTIPTISLERAAQLARASRHPLARALASAVGSGPIAADIHEVKGTGLQSLEGGINRKLGSAAWVLDKPSNSSSSELWFRDGEAPPIRLTFEDKIRPESRVLLEALRARDIAIEMLTGDQSGPAAAIARDVDIDRWQAGIGPIQKADYLRGLRAQGHRVLMIGDGINDAGAMAEAHVSVAPGTAADVSQLAADMVLRGDSLMPLVEALDVARKAKRLVLENFGLAIVYNFTAIPLAALGLVTPLIAAATMAGSSLIVTLNALRLVRP